MWGSKIYPDCQPRMFKNEPVKELENALKDVSKKKNLEKNRKKDIVKDPMKESKEDPVKESKQNSDS